MPLLPKPYPDEVIGSVIARAIWHNGLSLKAQLRDLYGGKRSTSSFLMSSGLHRLGMLAGMDADELLMQHTVFPYATAFMPSKVRDALKSKALHLQSEDCLSSLTKNASHGVPFRRVCESCVREDMATFGESYWRRGHLLPGALVCSHHGTLLRTTNIALRGKAQTKNSALPNMVESTACVSSLNFDLLECLTHISIEALNQKLVLPENLMTMYRDKSIELGFQLTSGDVAGRAISDSVRNLLGAEFLMDAGCVMSVRSPWVALMVQPRIGIPFATPKHVIFHAFLSHGVLAPENISSMYSKPGKKPTDYTLVDRKLSSRIKIAAKNAEIKKTRLTIKQLLADYWSTYRHHPKRFPETYEFLHKFRSSEQSERQVGVREVWRKRFPTKFLK
jgi:hypothetical protein